VHQAASLPERDTHKAAEATMSWNSWTAAEASSPQLFGPGIDLAEQPVSEELIILYPVLGVIGRHPENTGGGGLACQADIAPSV